MCGLGCSAAVAQIKKMVTKYGNDNDAGLIKDLMPYLKKLNGGKKK